MKRVDRRGVDGVTAILTFKIIHNVMVFVGRWWSGARAQHQPDFCVHEFKKTGFGFYAMYFITYLYTLFSRSPFTQMSGW